MDSIDTAVDKSLPSLDYKEFLQRPWLKRDYKEKLFIIPVEYLVEHLDRPDLKKVISKKDEWQEEKKDKVRKDLDTGTEPEELQPAYLTLHPRKHLFRVRDGISKISVFFERNIPVIKAKVLIGGW